MIRLPRGHIAECSETYPAAAQLVDCKDGDIVQNELHFLHVNRVQSAFANSLQASRNASRNVNLTSFGCTCS